MLVWLLISVWRSTCSGQAPRVCVLQYSLMDLRGNLTNSRSRLRLRLLYIRGVLLVPLAPTTHASSSNEKKTGTYIAVRPTVTGLKICKPVVRAPNQERIKETKRGLPVTRMPKDQGTVGKRKKKRRMTRRRMKTMTRASVRYDPDRRLS